MPAQQRVRRDDERAPVSAREDLARGRQEEPVDGRQRRTLGLAAQDGQFVLEYDDLQLFDIRRTPPPDRERHDTAKEEVANGDQHGASDGVRYSGLFASV